MLPKYSSIAQAFLSHIPYSPKNLSPPIQTLHPSTMGFRCAYSLDGQGHDFTSSYAKKYAKASKKTTTDPVAIPVPTKRPQFTRCAYSLDSQGHDLSSSYPKEYSTTSSSTSTMSSNNSGGAMLGDDGEWRAVYDLGQRPIQHEKHHSETSSSLLEQKSHQSV